jgi:elongation factor P
MIDATQIRKGMIIIMDGTLYRVMEMQLITPGRWKAMVQTKLRNIQVGSQTEHRFRSEERLEQARLDEIEMEFLYEQGGDYVFMNLENYEQVTLNAEAIGDAIKYLQGATKTALYKPAVLETGAVVQVPEFIKEGDVIRVDTREDKYLERAKTK